MTSSSLQKKVPEPELRDRNPKAKQTDFVLVAISQTYLLDDIRVIKFFKERDLSDGSAGYTFCLTWRGWESRDANMVTNITLSGIHHSQTPWKSERQSAGRS